MKKHYKYHFIVALGRFEPFHNGHKKNILEGLELAEKVIIILGSANKPRTIENPFTVAERQEFIRQSIPEKYRNRILFNSVEDTIYTNLEWVQRVQMAVQAVVMDYFPGHYADAKIAIIGHHKDKSTSDYLDQFKNWDAVEAGPYIKENGGIPVSATKIRELMFTNYLGYVQSNVPPEMYEWLNNFATTEAFADLKAEYDADFAYLPTAHEKMRNGEWATNFYTADGWLFQSGHVLLVKRKFNPGKGLWGSPGGHVEANEKAEDAIIREIYQETDLKVPERALRRCLVGEKLFDHPNRSLRGKTRSKNCRTITISYCYKLDDTESLARVHGKDDASEAWWFTLGEAASMRNQMFEDHPDQFDYWKGRIEK
jgi:bifunctional NMN adenylyltransferase/nudix hydrolase